MANLVAVGQNTFTMQDAPGSAVPSAPDRPPVASPAETLRRFLTQLAAGYQRSRAMLGETALPEARTLETRLAALELAKAALHYGACPAPQRPLQIAILGPTQTGKSTVVNLLLGQTAAEVSPLAGFTVHPHGFWVRANGEREKWTQTLLPGWERRDPPNLARDEFETYSLVTVPPMCDARPPADPLDAAARGLPHAVLWDTPDFDSLAARCYARGVLEIAALADIYVLVLSQEKYSDLSVWRLLELLGPLARPLVICLNKLAADAEDLVFHSLQQRLTEHGREWGDVPIVRLPQDLGLARGDVAAGLQFSPPLRSAIRGRIVPRSHLAGLKALLHRHWNEWLEPVRAELQAQAEWHRLVRAAGAQFVAAYTRDYLEHPQRYDSFRRAALELLQYLEIPAVAKFMGRARWAVTWPVRQLLALGRTWSTGATAASAHPLHKLGAETGVLIDALDGALTGLQRDVSRRSVRGGSSAPFWRALERQLDAERGRLCATFEAAIAAHHEVVTREIRAVAGQLYAELQKSPARLHALRAARAMIDVGYVLLAVKTGGLSYLAAVFAPATFAATSLLMEGVAELELGAQARALKVRQRVAVEQEFVAQVLVRELTELGRNLDPSTLFGVTAPELHTAVQALENWEARP